MFSFNNWYVFGFASINHALYGRSFIANISFNIIIGLVSLLSADPAVMSKMW